MRKPRGGPAAEQTRSYNVLCVAGVAPEALVPMMSGAGAFMLGQTLEEMGACWGRGTTARASH